MSTERLIGVMLMVVVVLSVLTFVDGFTRESARLQAEQCDD